jgi:hypothetical protein
MRDAAHSFALLPSETVCFQVLSLQLELSSKRFATIR